MSKYSRFVVLSSALLFMLLFGLACPVAVSADDGGPTPPATEEPALPPAATEEPAATEPVVIATEEPIVIEATPSPTVETVEESGAESSPDEEDAVDELLQAAGEDTKIVVLDENNKALPLASKQAVAVVTAVGPIWCPAGVQPGGAGCTAQFASPQDLIDDMAANPANYDEDGIIYFTIDSGGEFVLAPGSGALDGTDFDTIRGSNLTLQGGWSGKNGDTSFAQTNFDANAVQIGDDTNPWAGNITIKNITIDGAGTVGLIVITEGNINLKKVNSGGNDGDGAYLDNCALDPDTEECLGSGSITITSSTFKGNGSNGVEAYSTGNITLTGVKADGNNDNGLSLDNSYGSGNISIGSKTSVVTASGNGVDGIEAYSNGSLTLWNVTANGNGEYGADLMNMFGGSDVSIRSSTFSDNGTIGLFVFTSGDATLTGVNANGNGNNGATLMDYFGDVLVQDSHFDGNAPDPLVEGTGAGLTVSTFFGSIKLDNISASNNVNGYGVESGSYDLLIQNSIFDGNGYDGLSAAGVDAVIVCSQFVNHTNGVGVDGSGLEGIFTLTGVTFDNNYGDYLGTPVMQSGSCAIFKKGKSDKSPSHHSLPLHIVPVAGGEKVDLDCRGYSGTKLILPDGDNVILYCPVLDDAYLTSLDLQGLSTVPGGFTFVSGMEVKVTRGGEVRTSVGHNVVASFVVPEDKIGSNFTILHWDGSAWNELGGSYADGYFSVETSSVGVFILAIK